MTLEMLDMMEEKKLTKRNIQKYNQIHTLEHMPQDKRSKKYMARQCREAEKLRNRFHFHKKLKKITNTFKRVSISKTVKNNKINKILIVPQQICIVWEEDIQNLFSGPNSI